MSSKSSRSLIVSSNWRRSCARRWRRTQRAASVGQQLRQANNPLPFDAAGEAKLTGWRPQRDSGSPSFSSTGGGRTAPRLLEVRANGTLAYGSWRTTVLLDQGEYQ